MEMDQHELGNTFFSLVPHTYKSDVDMRQMMLSLQNTLYIRSDSGPEVKGSYTN
jgi:hypothetical protein